MLENQMILTANGLNLEYYMEQCIITKTVEDAEDTFVDAKERLLDVNHWGRYCDIAGAQFSLTDWHSRPVSRRAHKGDHVKIYVPGVAECCVVIDAIEYDDYPDLGMEAFTLRLHPCMHSAERADGSDCEGFSAALVIERRYKNVYTVYNCRNSADITATANTHDGCFGLTDVQWNGMLRRFVS